MESNRKLYKNILMSLRCINMALMGANKIYLKSSKSHFKSVNFCQHNFSLCIFNTIEL